MKPAACLHLQPDLAIIVAVSAYLSGQNTPAIELAATDCKTPPPPMWGIVCRRRDFANVDVVKTAGNRLAEKLRDFYLWINA